MGTLARAFPGRTAALALLSLLSGALPAVFAALVGYLAGQLPQALADDDIRLFDDPDLAASLDRGVQLARYGPGELVSGLSYQWTARAQGLAAAVLVGYYWPAAAVVLAIVWLAVHRAMQASYYRAEPFWSDPLRRARYLQRVGLLSPWAKEVRIFGLADWLVAQYSREWTAVMSQLLRARQADRRQMTLLGGLVLGVHVVILLLLARAAGSGSLSVPALIVILQGIFGMTMLASLQGDTWIENGSVPVPDVLALERDIAAGPAGLAAEVPGAGTAAGEAAASGKLAAALPPAALPPAGLPAAGLPAQSVSFRGVCFGYPGASEPVLDDFDLRLHAGRSVAIVGLNGAGKTTLVKLMTGLCRPASGTIEIDGTDLARLDLQSWRRQVAVIFQDFVRYELPLTDNLQLGAVERPQDPAALARIAGQAGIAELIAALPEGPATTLSPRFEGGVDISGGQWQRVAFARALTAVRAGARVLVMDEPTAHLDVRAEAEMYDRFLELTRGLTTVVISHRFSTVRRADRIVVLTRGRIVEDGSHAELMTAGGRYARMFALQASNYAGGSGD